MQPLRSVIDNLIGRRYQEGGRGPIEFDCFGLLIWVYREARGIELPDPLNAAPGLGKAMDVVRSLGEMFVELSPRDALQPLDVLYYTVPGSIRCSDHLLIVEDRKYAVHARFGSVARVGLEPYSRLPRLKAYRLKVLK